MALLSIIVPVYNADKYLNRCIESLINMYVSDIEIILVDDGSTDKSGDICDEYAHKDDRIRVIHKENSGVSAARNLGISIASGYWLAFVDSDDYVDNNIFRELLNCNDLNIESLGIQQAAMVRDNGEIYPWPFLLNSSVLDLKSVSDWDLLDHVLFCGTPWGKLFCRDVIIKNHICFQEDLSLHEDQCFYFDYIKYISRIIVTDSIGYFYRWVDGSLSRSMMPKYKKLLKVHSYLRNSILAISHKNRIDVEEIPLTISFVYSVLIRALNSSVLMESNREVAYYVYKQINKQEIQKYYNPSSFGGKLYKWILISMKEQIVIKLVLIFRAFIK